MCFFLPGYSPRLLPRRSIDKSGNELLGLASWLSVCFPPEKSFGFWFPRCKHSETYCFMFATMDGAEILRNEHTHAMRVKFTKNSTSSLPSFLTGSASLRYLHYPATLFASKLKNPYFTLNSRLFLLQSVQNLYFTSNPRLLHCFKTLIKFCNLHQIRHSYCFKTFKIRTLHQTRDSYCFRKFKICTLHQTPRLLLLQKR